MRRSKRLLVFLAPALCALSFGVASATAEPPQVSAPQVLDVSYTSAEVGGEVDARGEFTLYNFEVSADGGVSWETKGPFGAIEGSTLEPVPPFTMRELAPGTTYQVRLAANHLFSENAPVFSSLPNPEFTTTAVAAPGAAISAPDPVTGTSARFIGSITPGTPVGDPAAYDVEWHFECIPTCPGKLEGTIPADSTTTEVEVEATAEGITAGTDYEVTLVATNKGGTTSDGPVAFSTPTIAPAIGAVTAQPLTTEALLEGSINPGGLAATYYFEYGPTSAYGRTTPVTSLSVGGKPVQASKTIEGLSPEATYHYRLVATNSLGTEASGDRTFTTQSPAPGLGSCPNEVLRAENNSRGLADCRAYEKVSPGDKSDQGIAYSHVASSPLGDTISYSPVGASGGSEATGATSTQVVGTRGDEGWMVHPLLLPAEPPVQQLLFPSLRTISADAASVAILGASPSIPGAPRGTHNIYLRNGVTGEARLVTTTAPPNAGPSYVPRFGAASADLSHVVFAVRAALTPGAPAENDNLYLWDDGSLELASILPNENAAEEPSRVVGGGVFPDPRAMSADGSRLFFYVGGGPFGGEPAPLFLREGDVTTRISESQRTPSQGDPGLGFFLTATPDGSKAFFTSNEQLTNDSEAGGRSDLYRYDVDTNKLTDLTPTPGGAGVVGVIGDASDDGSYVYFVATGQLDGSRGTPGGNNLYVWHDGAPIRFIATLGSGSGLNEEIGQWDEGGAFSSFAPSRATTPDGRHLSFISTEPLTGYPSHGFPEVYSYDAIGAELTCISCNPSGAPAEGGSLLAQPYGGTEPINESRRVSDDAGTRVFFNSSDALLATDSNGVQDVYEWEADGTGSCRTALQNGGCLYLISSGRSRNPSFFAEASADGRDVFFTTTDRLTASDEDSLTDLYDARIDGGFPAPPPAQSCVGEACRGPGSTSGLAASPGSMSFSQSPAPSLRVSKARLKPGKMASLKVTVGEPGGLSWSGAGIAQSAKHLKRAGTSTIQVSLSTAAARKLKADGTFQTKLRLSFAGAAGRGTVRSIALNFTSPAQPASKSSERNG